jgi:BlaI family penicillinase repressor
MKLQKSLDEPKALVLHETEWDILDALWRLERATAREIAEALAEKRGWAYSTVKTLLDRLVAKELVRARRVGSVWEYTAAVDRIEARRSAWKRFLDAAFGGATAPALQFLAREARLTRKQRAELQALLEDSNDE